MVVTTTVDITHTFTMAPYPRYYYAPAYYPPYYGYAPGYYAHPTFAFSFGGWGWGHHHH